MLRIFKEKNRDNDSDDANDLDNEDEEYHSGEC